MPAPVVLLDRDGVLNVDRPDYVRTPSELVLLPGVAAALRDLRARGYRALVITNQAGVGRGLVTAATLTAIHTRLRELVAAAGGAIDGIYVCPHRPEDGCPCRKPKPGLIERARAEWGFEPRDTWFVGDSARDVEAARAARVRPALVRTGHRDYEPTPGDGVAAFDDLAAFVAAL